MRILFSGGGSGGHLMPLYSLQRAMKQSDCLYYLPPNDFDRDFANTYKLPHVFFSQTKFYFGSLFLVCKKIRGAFLEVAAEYKRNPWSLVVSTGGYAAVPVCMHAVVNRIPLYLVEPNSVAGKVNSLFAPFAKKVYTHFPYTKKLVWARTLNYGNPLREEIQRLEEPGEALLAFGASLGAQSINLLMSRLVKNELSCPVIWITGAKEYSAYSHLGRPGVTILPFSKEIDSFYRQAKLVIGRAGAGTVAEIQELGIPSILIPYPHHKDRQQFHNAGYLVENGSSIIKTEDELPESIDEILEILAPNSVVYASLLRQAKALPPKNAAQRIAKDIMQVP
ncbi:MAG: UDP-N-acetylglucosamine--N-acetylmuramyl-(pentapeptide) pyrophosphoryl-undecaprenol N-acetylglucosamine transferase [Candidatus Cloacimonetes bacterium]|nr:UDP-N-acetylglucosamine--N-acetylmuramyl-(pentapeptide) pyrophosphoryl-undecaprenol N-acetylglucosamine transferase [Candidatus Cloacimonadota bacterium]